MNDLIASKYDSVNSRVNNNLASLVSSTKEILKGWVVQSVVGGAPAYLGDRWIELRSGMFLLTAVES
jgi:hypothetical protein